MKNIIIWGTSRSGKSTLASRIKKEFGHSWIEIDSTRAIYDKLLPDNKIFEKADFEQGRMMGPMAASYIKELECATNSHNEYFIFEGVSLDIEHILTKLDKKKYIIICMAYQEITAGEKLLELNKYENEHDWTHEFSNEEKLEIIKEKLQEGKIVKDTAVKLGLKYFDTSFNRETVLNEALNYIKENL